MPRFPWSKTQKSGTAPADGPAASSPPEPPNRGWLQFAAGLMKDRLAAGRHDSDGECALYLGFFDVAQAASIADRLGAALGTTEQPCLPEVLPLAGREAAVRISRESQQWMVDLIGEMVAGRFGPLGASGLLGVGFDQEHARIAAHAMGREAVMVGDCFTS